MQEDVNHWNSARFLQGFVDNVINAFLSYKKKRKLMSRSDALKCENISKSALHNTLYIENIS